MPAPRSRSSAAAARVDTVHAEGFPLGMFPNVKYEEFSLSTQPGDSLIFFSDGITDAQNADGDMFGDDRLKAIVKKNSSEIGLEDRRSDPLRGLEVPGRTRPLRR